MTVVVIIVTTSIFCNDNCSDNRHDNCRFVMIIVMTVVVIIVMIILTFHGARYAKCIYISHLVSGFTPKTPFN